MKFLFFFIALFGLTISATAADISGTWKGSADTPGGKIERTFVFKVDGHKLTGTTTSNMFGESKIEDGQVDGDNVSFSITVNMQGNDSKVNYKGKVNGDEIKFTVDVAAMGQTIEYTVKRVS